ncbi:hypothetical protein GCM10027321_14140 [Massilia terrae]|uniref:Lipid-binding SYLF domain-containing protein n=1 Tax=Massilia terrae TaxID=1811224 RepID=A0ABT2CVW8_9BURK|nr:lipid-binding SYLF domain-containing protein [Massilia terrae]MCS0657741.1 lipid-binding SYLF domain-containing protein [Massilia terrae]
MSTPFARKSAMLLACAALLGGCSTTAPTSEETHAYVDDAQKTLAEFMRDPQMTWLQNHVHGARAVMVSPRIWQAGFVFGGSGGEMLVISRNRSGEGWNGPAFYKMGSGSFGLQAGAQETQMVALVMNEKALNSLLSTSFKLGGDLSIAAGPIGAGAGRPVTSDIVIFTRNKGLYGGINLDGTVITIDDGKNQVYYGRTTTPVDILIEGRATNPYSSKLTHTATVGVNAGPVK